MGRGRHELRKDIRLPARRGQASGFSGGGGSVLPERATITDISEGGVRLQFEWPSVRPFALNLGDGLGFRLHMDGSDDTFDLWSVVRHVHSVSGMNMVLVGVQFSGLESRLRESLKQALQNMAVTALRAWHASRVADAAAEAASPVHPSVCPTRAAATEPVKPQPSKQLQPEQPPSEAKRRKLFLGEILVKQGALDEKRLASFMSDEYSGKQRIGKELTDKGLVNDTDIARALAEQAKLGFVDLAVESPDLKIVAGLPREIFVANRCIPLRFENGFLLVAASAPLPLENFDAIKQVAGGRVRVLIAADDHLGTWLKRTYNVNETKRATGLDLAVQLHVEYCAAGADGEKSHEGKCAVGLTKQISRNGVVLAGPLPSGVTADELAAGILRLWVQVSCPDVTVPLIMLCTPLSVEQSEYRGELVIRCAIDRFDDGVEAAWHRICMLHGTVRFRPGSR